MFPRANSKQQSLYPWSGLQLMINSQALSSTCFGLFVTLTKHGVGRHSEYYIFVRPDHFETFFKIAWWYAWIIVIAYSSIKVSIACFLLRLADHRRHWRWVLYIIIGMTESPVPGFGMLTIDPTVILILFTIGSVLSIILQCIPISAAWKLSLRPPFGSVTSDAIHYNDC